MNLNPKDWLDKAQLAELLRVSRRELRERLMKQPDFPPPYWISSHRQFWAKADIAKWLANRKMG